MDNQKGYKIQNSMNTPLVHPGTEVKEVVDTVILDGTESSDDYTVQLQRKPERGSARGRLSSGRTRGRQPRSRGGINTIVGAEHHYTTSLTTADTFETARLAAWMQDLLDGNYNMEERFRVTQERVMQLYTLSSTFSCSGCLKGNGSHVLPDTNPRCLSSLGLSQWFRTDVFSRFCRACGIVDSYPGDLVRDAMMPVGLKNFGATCYMNALLQTWYYNIPFRSGIYSFIPTASNSSQLIVLLQRLFSHLQNGSRSCYIPSDLIDAMQLNRFEQQDAHEFSKLLLARICDLFATQEQPLSDLVKKLFSGTYVYLTTCSYCGRVSYQDTTFNELTLRVRGLTELTESLLSLLVDEHLDGDNQYYCEQCQSKRDATRRVSLKVLPPILSFQLLRFVYDTKSYTKKKVKSSFSFPVELDMSPFLGANETSSVWYDLTSVIMHRGEAAHAGHYLALVFDPVEKRWLKLDDDNVSVCIEGVYLSKESIEQFFFENKASSDAYMLTYTARKFSCESINDPSPPVKANRHVEVSNESLQKEILSFHELHSEEINRFKQELEQRRAISKCWNVEHPQEGNFRFVDSMSLKTWFASVFGKDTQTCTPTTFVWRCEHGAVNPKYLTTLKILSKEASELLISYGFDERAIVGADEALCHECVVLFAQERYVQVLQKQRYQHMQKLLSAKSKEYFLLSRSWIRDYCKARIEDNLVQKIIIENGVDKLPPFNTDLTCSHGSLACSRDAPRKAVTKSFCDYLISACSTGSRIFPMDSEECDQCISNRSAFLEATQAERDAKRHEKSFFKQCGLLNVAGNRLRLGTTYHIIEKDFFLLWQKLLKQPVESVTEELRPIDNRRLLCQHEMFRFDPAMTCDFVNDDFGIIETCYWEKLVEKYGGGPEIRLDMLTPEESPDPSIFCVTSVPVCRECTNSRQTSFESSPIIIVFESASESRRRLPRRQLQIKASATSTGRDVKIEIMRLTNVATIYLTLRHNDIEITNEMKLVEAGVRAFSVITAIVQTPSTQNLSDCGSVDDDSEENLAPGTKRTTLKHVNDEDARGTPSPSALIRRSQRRRGASSSDAKVAVETGFAGTNLLGSTHTILIHDSDTDDEERPSSCDVMEESLSN